MKKHFPVVLFTDTLEDRWVNGQKTDKLAHNLLIKMADKILVVLDPINNKQLVKIGKLLDENIVGLISESNIN